MRSRYAAGMAALVILGAGAAKADTVTYEYITGTTFNFAFSVATDPFVSYTPGRPSYSVSIGRQAAYVAVPPLELGLGRVNSMRIVGGDVLAGSARFVDTYIHGEPFTPLDPFELSMYGFHQFEGNLNFFAGDRLVGGAAIETSVGSLRCRGSGPGSSTCARSFGDPEGYILSVSPVEGTGDISPETAFLLAAFDDVEFSGNFDAEVGIPEGASYSGTWRYIASLSIEYDYTPVSQVPLPGAVWLLLSALAGLGLVQKRARKES